MTYTQKYLIQVQLTVAHTPRTIPVTVSLTQQQQQNRDFKSRPETP